MDALQSPSSTKRYLVAQDLVDPAQTVDAERVGIGALGTTIKVAVDGTDQYVVKAADDIGYEAPFDRSRLYRAAGASQQLSTLLADDGFDVPAVVLRDADTGIVVYECLPDSAVAVRKLFHEYRMSSGDLDRDVVRQAATVLARIHTLGTDSRFAECAVSRRSRRDAMRFDTHHTKVAQQYPAVASHAVESANTLLSSTPTLVHGDYSPRNVLVDRADSTLWVIDFEFTHVGHPVFDLAQFCNYLYLTECTNGFYDGPDFDSVVEFWDQYTAHCELAGDFERTLLTELPIRILTRIDGERSYSWIPRKLKDPLRSVARQVVADDVDSLPEFIAVTEAAFDDAGVGTPLRR